MAVIVVVLRRILLVPAVGLTAWAAEAAGATARGSAAHRSVATSRLRSASTTSGCASPAELQPFPKSSKLCEGLSTRPAGALENQSITINNKVKNE